MWPALQVAVRNLRLGVEGIAIRSAGMKSARDFSRSVTVTSESGSVVTPVARRLMLEDARRDRLQLDDDPTLGMRLAQ